METLIFGAQISVTILVVIFVVAILIQGVIALLVRFDQWLLNRAAANTSTTVESTPSNELSPEIIAVITAAAAETYGKKVRVKTIRYRRDAQNTSWVVQGRAAIMASHKVK